MPALRTLVKRVLFALLLVALLVYAADFAYFRIRLLHSKPDDPLETVTALRVLAIEQKGGRTEYTIDERQPQQTAVCAHSLFPRAGYPPCWYLKKKFAQPIPMGTYFAPRFVQMLAAKSSRELRSSRVRILRPRSRPWQPG